MPRSAAAASANRRFTSASVGRRSGGSEKGMATCSPAGPAGTPGPQNWASTVSTSTVLVFFRGNSVLLSTVDSVDRLKRRAGWPRWPVGDCSHFPRPSATSSCSAASANRRLRCRPSKTRQRATHFGQTPQRINDTSCDSQKWETPQKSRISPVMGNFPGPCAGSENGRMGGAKDRSQRDCVGRRGREFGLVRVSAVMLYATIQRPQNGLWRDCQSGWRGGPCRASECVQSDSVASGAVWRLRVRLAIPFSPRPGGVPTDASAADGAEGTRAAQC